jgi:hypothetical protein
MKGANLQSGSKVRAPLQVSRMAGEFSVDQILDLDLNIVPLPFLSRDDVLWEGTSTLVAARRKGGKSTIFRHLVHGWVTEGHKVLWFSDEFGPIWKRQLEALGIEKGAGHWEVVEALGRPPQELLSRAVRGPENLILVDTITWLLGVSLGNRDQVVEGLTPWIQLCGAGKTVLLLGHLTEQGRLAGSHAWGAGVDTLATYRGVEGQDDLRTIEVEGRMLAESPLRFAIRKMGSVFVVEDLPTDVTLTTPQSEALEVLSTDPAEARTWEEVSAATGFREGKCRKTLRDLVELGFAKDITSNLGTGGRGLAARYVKVEEEPEP